MKNSISILSPLPLFQYQDTCQCFQSFLCVIFYLLTSTNIYFLKSKEATQNARETTIKINLCNFCVLSLWSWCFLYTINNPWSLDHGKIRTFIISNCFLQSFEHSLVLVDKNNSLAQTSGKVNICFLKQFFCFH